MNHQLAYVSIFVFLVGGFLTPSPADCQVARTDRDVTTGTVISSSANTMVVRTEGGEYVLFVFDRDTVKPRMIPVRSRVRVLSRTDEEGIRVASGVTVTESASQPAVQGEAAEPVPPEVRRLERQIERQVRRYGAGFRAGLGLDPEIISTGVHARLGPFFSPNLSFRPNVEFGFGEVTTLFAINLEAVYRLPVNARQGRWSVYAGAGPSFGFIDRNFEAAQEGDRDIDFDDLDFNAGLNILTGLEFRNGMFVELKSTVYARPHVRVLVGFSF